MMKTSHHFCLQWSFYGPPNYEQSILMAISAPLGIAVFKHVSLSSWCMVQIEFGDQTCAKSWCILINKKEKPVHSAEMCFSPEKPHEALTESVTQAVGNSWDIAFTFTSPIFQEHHRIPFWSENLVTALKPSFVFSICTRRVFVFNSQPHWALPLPPSLFHTTVNQLKEDTKKEDRCLRSSH